MDRWEITALLHSYHAQRRRRRPVACMWFGHKDERPPGIDVDAHCWCARCGRVASWWFDFNAVLPPSAREPRPELEPAPGPERDDALQAAYEQRAELARVEAIVAAEDDAAASYTVERLDTPRDRIDAERRAIEA